MTKLKLLYGSTFLQGGPLFFVFNLHNLRNVLYRQFFERYLHAVRTVSFSF